MADEGPDATLVVGMDTRQHTAGAKQVVKNMDDIKTATEASALKFKSSWDAAVEDTVASTSGHLSRMMPADRAAMVGANAAKSMTKGLTDQFRSDQALVQSHLKLGLLDEAGAREAAGLNARLYNEELTKLLKDFETSGAGRSSFGKSGIQQLLSQYQKEPDQPKQVDHYASRSVGQLQAAAIELDKHFEAAKNHAPTFWEKLFPNSSHIAKARKDMGMLDALHDEAVKHVGAHQLAMSRLEYMFEHFVSHAAGINPLLGRLVGTMAHFAVGTIPMVAGLAVLAGAFGLWEDSMKPVHEQAKLLEEDLKKLAELAKKADERRQGPAFVMNRPTDELRTKEEEFKEHQKSSLFEGANKWFARHQGNTTQLEDEAKAINDLKEKIHQGNEELLREREASQNQQLTGLVSSRFATAEEHKLSIAAEKYYTAEMIKQQATLDTAIKSGDRGEIDKVMDRLTQLMGFVNSYHTANTTDPFESIRESAKDLIATVDNKGPIGAFHKSMDDWEKSAKKAGIPIQERTRDLALMAETLKKVHAEQLRPLNEGFTDSMAQAHAALFGKRVEEEESINAEIRKYRHDHKGMFAPEYEQAAKDIRGKHYADDQKVVNEQFYQGGKDLNEIKLKAVATEEGAKALRAYNVELEVSKMKEQAGLGVSAAMLAAREAQIRAIGAENEKLIEREEIESQIKSMVSSTVGNVEAGLDKIAKQQADEIRKFNKPMEDAIGSMETEFDTTVDKMLNNSLHSFRDFAKNVGDILSKMSGQGISLRIAEIVLGTRKEELDANGRPTGNFFNAGGMFGKGGLFQSETIYNKATDSDEQVGGRFERYAGAAKGVGGAVAGGFAGYSYGLTTTNKPQAAIGGAMEGAAAGSAFGPWGAVVGGVVGMVTGLAGSAHAAAQAAREMAEARKNFASSMEAYVAVATRTNSALGDALRQNQDQMRQLQLQANQAYSGKKNETQRNQLRAEIEATATENAKRLVEDWHKSLDEQINQLQGNDYSNQLATINKQYLENVNAAKAAGNAVEDLAKVEKIRTLELQKAQRAHELEVNTTKEDFRVRQLVSQGRTYEADRLRQQIAQEKEMAEATEKWSATNPELIEQLKKVQELERLHGATELANAIRNGPAGFKVLGYSYDYANPERPSTMTGVGAGSSASPTYDPGITTAPSTGNDTTPTQVTTNYQFNLPEGAIVINGDQDAVAMAKELVKGLRQIAAQTGGINATPSDTLDRI